MRLSLVASGCVGSPPPRASLARIERTILPSFWQQPERREPIWRDDGLHTTVACMTYGMSQKKLQEDLVHNIVKGAVEAEGKFICEALPCDLRSRQCEGGGWRPR